MRGRSYSYSPSPPRGYGRSRRRSPSPRGRYGGRSSRDMPTSLLVRNLRHDCRQPRGFGFIQFVDPGDAAEAKYHMDGEVLFGRELTVVFAEENRKKPSEMRARDRVSEPERRRPPSPPRYRRSRYSRSPAYSPSPRGRRYSRYILSIPSLSPFYLPPFDHA
ncbi:Serine/arginine-rich SC35-like splicing factor SCL30A [Linum grandiflorum]